MDHPLDHQSTIHRLSHLMLWRPRFCLPRSWRIGLLALTLGSLLLVNMLFFARPAYATATPPAPAHQHANANDGSPADGYTHPCACAHQYTNANDGITATRGAARCRSEQYPGINFTQYNLHPARYGRQ